MTQKLDVPAGGSLMTGIMRSWYISDSQRVRCVWMGDKWAVRHLNELTDPEAIEALRAIRQLMRDAVSRRGGTA